MKKLLGLLLSGILTIGMVGCKGDTEPVVEEKEVKQEQKVEDEYVQPEEVKEPEEAKEEPASKEEIAILIKTIVSDSMGSRYIVNTTITEDGTCMVGVLDSEMSYSSIDNATLQSMCYEAGIPSSGATLATSCEEVFASMGNPTKVLIAFGGNDGNYFIVVDSHGNAMFN